STLTNTATISATTTDPVSSNNSSTTTVTVNTQADLSVTKSGPASVLAGNNLTYAVTVTNNGPSNAQSVALSDLLPTGTTFVSQSQGGGPSFVLGNTGNQIQDTITTLAAGASQTFTIVTHVISSLAEGTTLSNTATVSTTTTDPISGNNSS